MPVSEINFVKKKNGNKVGKTFLPKSKTPFRQEDEYFCGLITMIKIKNKQKIAIIKFAFFFMLNFIFTYQI